LVSQVLGLPAEQLAEELDGKSVADVAAAHGVAPPIVLEALATRSLRRIAEAVEGGRISPEYGLEAFPRLARRAALRLYRRAAY
jgi:hypothetical protein